MIRLLALVLVSLPAVALAADPTIKFTGVVEGQSYEFIYANGTATLRLIPTVAVGGVPTPPQPPPPPNPTSLAAQVQALTQAALFAGGSTNTAARLAGVYFIVGEQVESGKLPLTNIAPALKDLSDFAIPTAEKEIWAKWRTGVGDLLTTKVGTKPEAVASLKAVETGIKSSGDNFARAHGEKAIDWGEIFKLIWPFLLALLQKWLTGM